MGTTNGQVLGVTTNKLWARLFKSPSAEQYLLENREACGLPAFCDYISALSDKRGMGMEAVINGSGLERSFGYHLFRGTRNPSRDTVLQLAFGFGLTVEETQELLKVGRMSALHPRVKRDAVVAHCLSRKKDLLHTNQMLAELALPILGGKKL